MEEMTDPIHQTATDFGPYVALTFENIGVVVDERWRLVAVGVFCPNGGEVVLRVGEEVDAKGRTFRPRAGV